jgi:hypothetical protein
MKAPGIRAKKTGTKLKRGAATQIMCYPRLETKAVLVEASHEVNRPLSSFMIMASLRAAAALKGCEIAELIPPDELEQYGKIAQLRTPLGIRSLQTRTRSSMNADPKRSAAAKRAWLTIRAGGRERATRGGLVRVQGGAMKIDKKQSD